jgi:hypothetical protein
VVHGSAQGLTAITALAALLVLPLAVGAALLLAAAALAAATTTEAASTATSVSLAAGLLGRLRSGQSRSVTAGLWWGRNFRLWREIRFVVHYILRYGGLLMRSCAGEPRRKFLVRVGFQHQPCSVELCNRTSTHERGNSRYKALSGLPPENAST